MRIIAVSGMMGTGKTTLCDGLAKLTGWTVVREDVGRNPFLPLFYYDSERWALASQLNFMLNKTAELIEVLKSPGEVILIDRTIQEDMHVFSAVLREFEIITIPEYDLISQLYALLLPSWPRVDFTIYLEDTDENCFQRLLSRGHVYESKMEMGYVRSVGDQYRKWRRNFLRPPYYQLNPSKSDFRKEQAVADVLENILPMLRESAIEF